MSNQYAIGLDYGTNSCRSLLVDLHDGTELGTEVFDYPSGELGILTDPKDPNVARQNPQDYLDGLEAILKGALQQAKAARTDFDPAQVIGIGVDTTGSTPIPVDAAGTPLALKDELKDELAAHVWLWKDHTAHAEAAVAGFLARLPHHQLRDALEALPHLNHSNARIAIARAMLKGQRDRK